MSGEISSEVKESKIMIFDKIENIYKYPQIDTRIADFIMSLSKDVCAGKIFLSDDKLTFANVDEYVTKNHQDCKLEAHKKYIDIQLLLDGVEELDYIDIQGLEVSEVYDEARDVMFFAPTDKILNKVVLSEGNFVMLYPNEAHQPQMAYDNLPSNVKKVVVKIPVTE